jgi:hypothetical protein
MTQSRHSDCAPNDFQQAATTWQLEENLKLGSALAAEVAKAKGASVRGAMSHRLGWVHCVLVAVGWAVFSLRLITSSFAVQDIALGQWVAALGPALILYGPGRAFRYVLSG